MSSSLDFGDHMGIGAQTVAALGADDRNEALSPAGRNSQQRGLREREAAYQHLGDTAAYRGNGGNEVVAPVRVPISPIGHRPVRVDGRGFSLNLMNDTEGHVTIQIPTLGATKAGYAE